MILSANLSIASALLVLLPTPEVVAHGYLKSPRSRNYFAHTDGVWWGGTASDPKPENCECLSTLFDRLILLLYYIIDVLMPNALVQVLIV